MDRVFNWKITEKNRQNARESQQRTLGKKRAKGKQTVVYCQGCNAESNKPYTLTRTVNTNVEIKVCKECYEKLF